MKQWQNRNLEMRNDLDRTVLARDEARAEVERLKLKRREQFNRWGVEIRYDDQEQMALRLERAEAEVERLRHELDDAKRSRDDAIGRYVESQ
jgi:hypothetical protein